MTGLNLFKQEAEEAAEADEVTEPPFSKGTLHVGKPYVISITVLQAQGIPAQYTDIFCQIRSTLNFDFIEYLYLVAYLLF